MDGLCTINEALLNQIVYLKNKNKADSIYTTDLDNNNIVIELFFKYSYNKKINREQLIQKLWKNNMLNYRTE